MSAQRAVREWSGETKNRAHDFHSQFEYSALGHVMDFVLFKKTKTPSNKKVEISTIGSNYHIEINPR